MPVVDGDGGLVGLISRTDVLAVYDRPDEDIREEITGNVILREFPDDPRQFAVTVEAGVVTVEGARRPPRSATIWCARPGTSRAWWRSATASATATSTGRRRPGFLRRHR